MNLILTEIEYTEKDTKIKVSKNNVSIKIIKLQYQLLKNSKKKKKLKKKKN
jgi:hypothetical protein